VKDLEIYCRPGLLTGRDKPRALLLQLRKGGEGACPSLHVMPTQFEASAKIVELASNPNRSDPMPLASYPRVRPIAWSRRPILLAAFIGLFCSAAIPTVALTASEKNWVQLQKDGTDNLDANKYWLAEPLLHRALAKAETFGNADLRLAKSLGEVGRLYTIRGRFADAEPYLERELSVKQLALGKSTGNAIPAMVSLIQFYLAHGTESKALPLTKEVLSFVEGKLDEPMPEIPVKIKYEKHTPLEAGVATADPVMINPLIEWAIACDSLGNSYLARRDYALADRLFKAALDLKATVLGKGHLSLANSYDSLGTVCMARKENKDAESYYRDALATTERTLDPESPQIYSRMDKLAKCLIQSGKYKQAEDIYLKAHHDFWKTEPSKGGDEARVLYALGCLYLTEKKYASAAPVFHQALLMAERINGPYSIGLVPYLEQYAYTLYYLGRRAETDNLRARANSISGGSH